MNILRKFNEFKQKRSVLAYDRLVRQLCQVQATKQAKQELAVATSLTMSNSPLLNSLCGSSESLAQKEKVLQKKIAQIPAEIQATDKDKLAQLCGPVPDYAQVSARAKRLHTLLYSPNSEFPLAFMPDYFVKLFPDYIVQNSQLLYLQFLGLVPAPVAQPKTQTLQTLNTWEQDQYQLKTCRHPVGFMCGYVSWNTGIKSPIPEDHPLLKEVQIHGGVSFHTQEKNSQTLGFDCAHYGDMVSGIANSDQYKTTDQKIRDAHPQPDQDLFEDFAQRLQLLRDAAKDHNLMHFTRPIDQELMEIHTLQLAGQLKLIHENIELYKTDPELAIVNVRLGIQENGLNKDPIENDAVIKKWLESLRQQHPNLDID